MGVILTGEFFHRDCLEVAPDLCGKELCVRCEGGVKRLVITETEAYRGEEDTACHASKGRTRRTEILYGESGLIYVYLCYGMHWLMNIVTGEKDQPQAVLLRAAQKPFDGPGKLTRYLGIDKSFNGCHICSDPRVWFEDSEKKPQLVALPRVGIDYASEEYRLKPWRFCIRPQRPVRRRK